MPPSRGAGPGPSPPVRKMLGKAFSKIWEDAFVSLKRVLGCRCGSRYVEGEIPFYMFWKIGPISKIPRFLLDGSAGLFGADLFPKIKMMDFPFFEIYTINTLVEIFCVCSEIFDVPEASPKKKSYWFCGSGTRQKIPKSWTPWVSGRSHEQIDKSWMQGETEEWYQAFQQISP